MTDEKNENAERDDAPRDDAELESAELGEEQLEKASGGNYTSKNPNSPFDP